MKYSINYYSAGKRKLNKIHIVEPKTSNNDTFEEHKNYVTESAGQHSNKFQFVVPWQMP